MGIVPLRKRTLGCGILAGLVLAVGGYLAFYQATLYWNRFTLDLKTGDEDVWFEGRHWQIRLPSDLRDRIQAESLSIDDGDRYLHISPAWIGTHEIGFLSIMDSGGLAAEDITNNFSALGLWLKTDPSIFGPRLRAYQAYLLQAYRARQLPAYYPIPEMDFIIFEMPDALDPRVLENPPKADVEKFRANKDAILKQPINGPEKL